MSAAIRVRARAKGSVTELMVLMPHPMESGFRKDAAGAFVPAHFITDVRVVVEQRLVFEASLSPAVSQDPLITVRFRGGRPGDRIAVTWLDNRGDHRTEEAVAT